MKTVRFNNKIAALKRLKEAGIKDEKDLQKLKYGELRKNMVLLQYQFSGGFLWKQ